MPKQRIFYNGEIIGRQVIMSDVAYVVVSHYMEKRSPTYEELIDTFNKKNCGISRIILEKNEISRKEDYCTEKSPYLKIKDSDSKEIEVGILREWEYNNNFAVFRDNIKK